MLFISKKETAAFGIHFNYATEVNDQRILLNNYN
jgi:hypothetical protein